MNEASIKSVLPIVGVATIGGFLFGYDSGVINGTQKGLETAFGLSWLGTGINVGAILVGCAIGAFLAGRLADLIGRRRVMMLAAAVFVVSALATGAAPSSLAFVLARLVSGLSVGAASVISPVYISEVVPAAQRGRLSSLQQVMIISGLTAAFVVNYILSAWGGSSLSPLWLQIPAWRWMFFMQTVPATIYLFALLLVPESPRWLVFKNRDAEAHTVLTRLSATDASAKIAQIRASLGTSTHKPQLSDVLDPATGQVRRIVWAGIGLAIFQQLSGIVAVFYYGAVLWQSVGFSEADALKINIVSGLLSVLACMFAIGTIDRIGRKPLLLAGSAGMAVMLFIVAICFSSAAPAPDGGIHLSVTTGRIALIAANLFVAIFNATWGPVMWVMLGEMFPNRIRGSSLAIAGAAQWTANLAISVSFPVAAAVAGLGATYGFYALCTLASLVFVWKIVPETRGCELEDMSG